MAFLLKKRKSVEYNGFELIFAMCAYDYSIKTKQDIMDRNCNVCSDSMLIQYKKDVESRKEKDVKKYIDRFRSTFPYIITEPVTKVYLEGKTLTTQKLKDLNHGINIKLAKSDVYVETQKEIIGFSIKQDKGCTKTNFSVEKMIYEIVQDKKVKLDLSNARKLVLKSAGIDSKNLKQNRDKANDLFYDSLEGTNIYWNMLRYHINENIDKLKDNILKNLYPSASLSYKTFEFDGSTMETMFLEESETYLFESPELYFNDKGERRKAAKMFYKLIVNDKEYRIEIRFKGNAWSGSPQFQTHYIE